MSRNITITDFIKICRTCLLRKQKMKLITTTDIVEKLKTFCHVNILPNDGLPFLICLDCIDKINVAHSFKILCEESEHILKEILRTQQFNPFEEHITKINNQNETEDAVKLEEIVNDDVKIEMIKNDDSIDNSDYLCNMEVKDELNNSNEETVLKSEPVQIRRVRERKLRNRKIDSFDLLALSCKYCNRGFRSQRVLQKHVDLHVKQKKHQCQICKKPFVKKSELIDHSNVHKSDVTCEKSTETICEFCDKKFSSSKMLQRHIESHTRQRKRHKCPDCDREYAERCELVRHRLSHRPRDEVSVQCPLCGKTLAHEFALRRHHRYVHDDTYREIYKTKRQLQQKQLESAPCPYCNKIFDSKKLKRHVMCHNAERKHVCETCDKRFISANQLEYHKLIHRPKDEICVQCPECGKKLAHSIALRKHLRIKHERQQEFVVCNVCGKSVLRERIKRHVSNHSKEPSEEVLTCALCPKTYRSRYGLQCHVRIKHENNPPPPRILCSICGKGCYTLYELKSHMTRHSDERRYACHLCNKTYKLLSALNHHIRVHKDERPYLCNICQKGFHTSTILKKHVKMHIREKIRAGVDITEQEKDLITNGKEKLH